MTSGTPAAIKLLDITLHSKALKSSVKNHLCLECCLCIFPLYCTSLILCTETQPYYF